MVNRVTTSGSMSGNEWQQVTTNNSKWYNKSIFLTTFFAVHDFFSFSLINIPSLISRLLDPSFFRSSHRRCSVTYNSSYNLAPAISQFWWVNTWFFAHSHDQRTVIHLKNVRQLNIRQDKKLDFQLLHTQPRKKRRS